MSTKIHAVYTLSSARQIPLLALPLWSQTTAAWKTDCMLHGSRRLVWTLSTASDEQFPTEIQTVENFFSFLFFFFTPTCFFPTQKFPPTKKSKLLKDWVQSCFDFWYIALLKRDLATRQCSEDEHCPSDSTLCQCLSQRKTEQEGKKETEWFCNLLWNLLHFQFEDLS